MVPESERYPGEGKGNPLQYSCLENPMDREAWCMVQYSPWGHKESEVMMTEHIHTSSVQDISI